MENEGQSLQLEKQQFVDNSVKALERETRATLTRRTEGDLKKENPDYYDELSNLVEGLPTESTTALHTCSGLDFDTFWTEVELGEGRRRKTLHIVIRLNGDPLRPHLSYASEPGSSVPDEGQSIINEAWRKEHLEYPLGEYPFRHNWKEDFLQEREKRLSIFIKSNLLFALQKTGIQTIEEGLLYDLLTDEEYESFITRRCRDIAQQVGERMGRYRRTREASYDLADLSDHYKALRPKWRLAMKDAKAYQNHPRQRSRWRERIVDDYEFDNDLVEWLSLDHEERERNLESHPYSGYLRDRRKSSKGADDQQYELLEPRDLALEQAARLCGTPPYFYSVSHLKGIQSSQKNASSNKRK